MTFPTSALLGLQQLTYLELACVYLQGPDLEGPALQPLQALTRLADLRLAPVIAPDSLVAVDGSMLSGMQHLTRLEVGSRAELDPGALAGKTRLQHLKLSCSIADAATTGLTQLLSELQQLQQLTHLVLTREVFQEGDPPAASISALTASSKLQQLILRGCPLASAAWPLMFPAGRQLPHLQSLDISRHLPSDEVVSAPEGSRLVSCCPGLRSLHMRYLQYSAELLAPLQGLGDLHTLHVATVGVGEGLEVVGQLTGLRDLSMFAACSTEGLLLQLTQLKQLTRLCYTGCLAGECPHFCTVWTSQVGLPSGLFHKTNVVK